MILRIGATYGYSPRYSTNARDNSANTFLGFLRLRLKPVSFSSSAQGDRNLRRARKHSQTLSNEALRAQIQRPPLARGGGCGTVLRVARRAGENQGERGTIYDTNYAEIVIPSASESRASRRAFRPGWRPSREPVLSGAEGNLALGACTLSRMGHAQPAPPESPRNSIPTH